MNVIEINKIKKKFKAYEYRHGASILEFRRKFYWKRALKGVSFSVKEGEIVALLGKNGSGKSTLIKVMCGILHPDSGTAQILGYEPWTQRVELVRNMGVVLGAHGQLMWDLPAMDSFNMMRRIYRIPDKDFKERLDYFLDMLELREVYKRQVRTLSLGEQMKCNFIASILHMPPLVILDEPTIGVDISSKQALKNAILKMNSERKTTFLLTTHIVEDISMANRIIVLDKGNLVFDGSRHKLENLFGNKRVIRIDFNKTPDSNDYKKYGRITESKENSIRLEVKPSVLTTKAFTQLLSGRNVIDYAVGTEGTTELLVKLYASASKRKGVG